MAEATVREHLVVRISSLKNELTRAEELGHISSSTFDYLRYKSELLYEHAVRLSPTDSSNVAYNEVLFKLRQVAIILRELEPTDEQLTRFQTTTGGGGNRGRPKFIISQEQLEYLISNGFSAVDIGRLLQVSLSTVRRRLRNYGIDTSRPFSDLCDEKLSELLREIRKDNPRSGYRMMLGHLRARGYRVPQLRVRQMMQKEDPEGTVTRWVNTVKRRVYSVSGPNALWHIDGNHKLIRYLVILFIGTFFILLVITGSTGKISVGQKFLMSLVDQSKNLF